MTVREEVHQDHAKRRRRAARMAMILGAAAIGVYAAFILMHL
ncbi:MAG: hypothetical protein AAF384_00930 [Pseudomonadota bacterium]